MTLGRAPFAVRAMGVAPLAGAIFVTFLLAAPLASGTPVPALFVAPFGHYGGDLLQSFDLISTNTTQTNVCLGPGSSANATPATFSMKTGAGQAAAAVSARTCAPSTLDANLGASGKVGIAGIPFNVTRTGLYNLTAKWIVGFAVNLSVKLNGSPTAGTPYWGSQYRVFLFLHIFWHNTTQGFDRHRTIDLGTSTIINGTLSVVSPNSTYVLHIRNVYMAAGDRGYVTANLQFDIGSDYVYDPGSGGAIPPAGSILNSSIDMSRADGFGYELESLAIR